MIPMMMLPMPTEDPLGNPGVGGGPGGFGPAGLPGAGARGGGGGGGDGSNADDVNGNGNGNAAAATAWRERQQRQRSVRSLMMFLMMLLLMDGENEENNRRGVEYRRQQRLRGDNRSAGGPGGDYAGKRMDGGLFGARREHDRGVTRAAAGDSRARDVVERNGGADVRAAVGRWAWEEAIKRSPQDAELSLSPSGKTKTKKSDREEKVAVDASGEGGLGEGGTEGDMPDATKVFHYPRNATGYYRGEWAIVPSIESLEKGSNDDDADHDAALVREANHRERPVTVTDEQALEAWRVKDMRRLMYLEEVLSTRGGPEDLGPEDSQGPGGKEEEGGERDDAKKTKGSPPPLLLPPVGCGKAPSPRTRPHRGRRQRDRGGGRGRQQRRPLPSQEARAVAVDGGSLEGLLRNRGEGEAGGGLSHRG